jgi:hypothetical protein
MQLKRDVNDGKIEPKMNGKPYKSPENRVDT